jgi:glycosyltransferase involved in cell wall biosynthesis
MNIVYLCHYFYPEMVAPSARVLEMSCEWVKAGHQVTVVTCFPNHPNGVIPKEYRGCFFMEEHYLGIRVLRNYVFATPNRGVFKRTLGHLSFMISSVIFSLSRLGKADIIIASSPTFFSVFSAFMMSWIKNIPFIFEVRDLWPAAISEVGAVKLKSIIKILEFWELFLYHRAKKVVVVTQSFKDNLVERGIPESKIEIIYNGVEPERFGRIDAQTAKQNHSLTGYFIILYAGTLGLSHGLENVLLAAQKFSNINNVRFLFVGEGAMKEPLKDMANKLQLENVIFWPGQPREKMPEIYALADVCIVSLKKVQLFNKFIPSKIFEIMASKRPIIACLTGEAAQILQNSGSAIVVPQEDFNALGTAIQTLIKDKELRHKMGAKGFAFVAKYFNRSILAKNYETILRTAIGIKVKISAKQKPITRNLDI